jgi:hypothetical protein
LRWIGYRLIKGLLRCSSGSIDILIENVEWLTLDLDGLGRFWWMIHPFYWSIHQSPSSSRFASFEPHSGKSKQPSELHVAGPHRRRIPLPYVSSIPISGWRTETYATYLPRQLVVSWLVEQDLPSWIRPRERTSLLILSCDRPHW